MSAHELASAGLLYLPPQGFNASAIVQYVGDRFLNKRNTAPADAYTTYAAGLGYRFGHFEIRVDGETLWSRQADGGFPDLPELKRLVRDHVAPGKPLGHTER